MDIDMGIDMNMDMDKDMDKDTDADNSDTDMDTDMDVDMDVDMDDGHEHVQKVALSTTQCSQYIGRDTGPSPASPPPPSYLAHMYMYG